MSLSFSDCFPDLLCAEDSAAFSYDSPSDFSSDLDSPAPSDDDDDEDSIAGFIEDETSFVPRFHYFSQIQSDPSARAFSISWMLKVIAARLLALFRCRITPSIYGVTVHRLWIFFLYFNTDA